MAPQKMKKKKLMVDAETDKKKTRLHICFADANDSPFGERGRSLTVEFDQTETCRLCLKRSDEPIEIFTEDKLKSYSKQYKINQLLGIEMAEDDGLPRVICEACSARLEDLFLFHMECQNSNTILSASVELSNSSNKKKVHSAMLQTSSKKRAIDIYKDSDEEEESLAKSSEEDEPQEVSSDDMNENDSQLYQQPDSSDESFDENDYEHFKEEKNDNFFVIIGSRGSITGPAPQQISPPKVEPKPLRYQCPYCPKDFASNVWLLRHKKTHTEVNQNAFIPSVANDFWQKLPKKAPTEMKLKTVGHISSPVESPEKEEPYDNGETLEDIKQFVSNSQIDSSCEMYSDTKVQFECDICNACFDYEDELRNHQTEHYIPEVFTPPVRQSISMLTEPAPSKKRKSASIDSRPVKKQNTSAVGNLPRTFATVNTKYVCVYCSRILVGKATLQQHTMKHREDQPRVCKICTKTLRSEEQLALCVESHKGDPSGDFACKVCGVSFHYRTFVEFHAKVLHMDLVKQKYKCNQCKESFHLESDLLQHLKTHIENVLPKAIKTDMAKRDSHICQYCDKKFVTKASLRKHILTWHDNPEAESDERHVDPEEHFSTSSKQTVDFKHLSIKPKEYIPTSKNHPVISKQNISGAAARNEESCDHPQELKAIVTDVHSVESKEHISENDVDDLENSKDSHAQSKGSQSERYDVEEEILKTEGNSENHPVDSLMACKDPQKVGESDCVKNFLIEQVDHPADNSMEHADDSNDDPAENKSKLSVSGHSVQSDDKESIKLKDERIQNISVELTDLPTESKDHCVEDPDAESIKNVESEHPIEMITEHPTNNDDHPKSREEPAVVSEDHPTASIKDSTDLDAVSVKLSSGHEVRHVMAEDHSNNPEDHFAKSDYIATSGELTAASVINIAASIEDSSELDSQLNSSTDNPSEQKYIPTSKHDHVSEYYVPSFGEDSAETNNHSGSLESVEHSASTEVDRIKSVHLVGSAEELKKFEDSSGETGDVYETPQTVAADEFDEWGISPAIHDNL